MPREIKAIRVLRAALERCERERDRLRERKKTRPTPRAAAPTRRGPVAGRNEALAWLTTATNPHPFASNIFSRASAREMVSALYSGGAALVQVSHIQKEPRRLKDEGGPYADTLIVTPQRGTKEYLMKLLKDNFQADQVDPEGNKIRAWWD